MSPASVEFDTSNSVHVIFGHETFDGFPDINLCAAQLFNSIFHSFEARNCVFHKYVHF